MPTLQRIHEIVAADACAQAKFLLLKTELHCRYTIGIMRLFICRATLAYPAAGSPPEDHVAAPLQPSIAPGTTDLQAPLESQGRGFVHGHG